MPRRSYHQHCGLAKSLDVVGERWTMLIVRNLLLGPLRYSDLLNGLPGITTNLLAKRLKELENAQLVERVRASAADASHSYRLTPNGAALEPVVHALGGWGWQWMGEMRRGDFRSVDFAFVALRRRYLGGKTLRAEIIADDALYHIVLTPRRAEIARGGVSSPDLQVRGKGEDIARLFLDPKSRKHLSAALKVEGPRAALHQLVGAFSVGELLPAGR